MKSAFRFLSVLVIVYLAAGVQSVASGQEQSFGARASIGNLSEADTVKIDGYLLENYCYNEEQPDDPLEFAKAHPKSCLLLPICVNSGFIIVSSDSKIYPIERPDSCRVVTYLEEDSNGTHVQATLQKNGSGWRLISLENRS